MTKTANLYARIEPEIKAQAEEILSTLGISASTAISMFYKQIILRQGLPFEAKLPAPEHLCIGKMTQSQFDAAIQEGLASLKEKGDLPAGDAFAQLYKEFGIDEV